jgi:hypothetical protein
MFEPMKEGKEKSILMPVIVAPSRLKYQYSNPENGLPNVSQLFLHNPPKLPIPHQHIQSPLHSLTSHFLVIVVK